MVYVAKLPKIPLWCFASFAHLRARFVRRKAKYGDRLEGKSWIDSSTSLFVCERRSKEQDQGSKRSNSDDGEEISTEVADTGSNHLRWSNLVGELSDGVFHHVQLRSFLASEWRGNWKKHKIKSGMRDGVTWCANGWVTRAKPRQLHRVPRKLQ